MAWNSHRWYLTAPTLVVADVLGAIAFVLLIVVGVNLATTSTVPTLASHGGGITVPVQVPKPPQVTRIAPPNSTDTATPINTSTIKQTVTVGPDMPYFLRPGG